MGTHRRAPAWLVAASLAASACVPSPRTPPPAPVLTPAQVREWLELLHVPSPVRMSAAARASEIEYRLALRPARAYPWPATGEQRVRVDGDAVVLNICATCGDEAAPDAATLARYLAPNAYVQSDDRRIRAFARRSVRGSTPDARMHTLAEAVRAHMTGPISFTAYGDAITALEQRSGDCTEYALLLAASGRAVGIPTRVVYGIAYASRFTGRPHVFAPHVWVQAWNGTRWVSADAGLGTFGAGHIAMAVGDGTPTRSRAVNEAIRDLEVLSATGVVRTSATPSGG
jgi:transglutaminase-like putative cysteine protease